MIRALAIRFGCAALLLLGLTAPGWLIQGVPCTVNQTFSTAGTFTYKACANATLHFQTWGGGGSGTGDANTTNLSAGAYAEGAIAVTAGSQWTVVVGVGGIPVDTAYVVGGISYVCQLGCSTVLTSCTGNAGLDATNFVCAFHGGGPAGGTASHSIGNAIKSNGGIAGGAGCCPLGAPGGGGAGGPDGDGANSSTAFANTTTAGGTADAGIGGAGGGMGGGGGVNDLLHGGGGGGGQIGGPGGDGGIPGGAGGTATKPGGTLGGKGGIGEAIIHS